MAMLRKLFFRKPPDGLLEISERVYVFDCCFTTDAWEEEDYKVYVGGIVGQLRDYYPDASILVFNFREGGTQSRIANALSEYDMTIMDYPRQYEGCPLLPMEVIHHFLRSSESWLSLGQQNVLLMHCELGGWPVLAFMLAALLIYRKQYTGEQRTLDMIYKQAPRELLHLLSPLNPFPSQQRYLQYVSRRNVASEWPPLERAVTLDCIIIRMIPNFDGEGGCRPIFRIYGQDPFHVSDRTPKVLFSTPKRSKIVRHYKQAECELVKIDIHCHIKGDVVLECISLHNDMEREEMVFRVMFNTAFIRSNILILNRDEIDILWDAKDHFPKDFRAEVLFSDMDAAASIVSPELSCFEEREGLPEEAFAKVQEIFNSVDWIVPTKSDVALNVLQQITASNIPLEKLDNYTLQSMETKALLQELRPAMIQDRGQNKSEINTEKAPYLAADDLLVPRSQLSTDANLSREDAEPQSFEEKTSMLSPSTPPRPPPSQLSLSQTTRSNTSPLSPPLSKSKPSHKSQMKQPDTFLEGGDPSSLVRSSAATNTPFLGTSFDHVVLSPPSHSITSVIDTSTAPLPSPSSKETSAFGTRPPPPHHSPITPSPPSDLILKDSDIYNGELPVSSPPQVVTQSSNKVPSIKTGSPPPPPPLPDLPSVSNQVVSIRSSPTLASSLKEDLSGGAGHIPSSPPPSTPFLKEHSVILTRPSSHSSSASIPTPPATPPLKETADIITAPAAPPPPPASPLKDNSTTRTVPPPSPPPPAPQTPPLKENSALRTRPSPTPPPPPAPPLKENSVIRIGSPALPPPPPPPPLKESSAIKTGSPTPPPPPTTPHLKENLAIRTGSPTPPPPPPRPGKDLGTTITPSVPLPPPPPAFSSSLKLVEPSLKSPSHIPAAPPPPAPVLTGDVKTDPILQQPLSRSSNGCSTSPAPPSPAPPSPAPPSPAPPSPAPPMITKGRLSRTITSKNSQSKKLKPLHWLKLSRAVQGSLWAEAQKSGEASRAPEIDMSELENLFSVAAPNSASGSKSNSRASIGSKAEKVQLVDHRRAYNCEIMLSKVKIPLHELLSSVLALEDSALDVDQVDSIVKFCPTKEEMELLKGYNGELEKLGRCEQFFLELMRVPRVESKLRVFSFKIQFNSQVSDLKRNLNVVNSAAEEIRSSVKLKRVMQTILSLGNALNQGTARGSAVGFKLDSLLKLTETRARNNKMTLMHYLCKVLADKLPELLDFSKDLASLESASKIQLKFLAEEMQAISKGLEKVIQELSLSESDGPVSEDFRKTLKKFLSSAEAEVRSLASLYSGVGRNVDALILYFGEDPARCQFEQVVSTLLNFVRMFNNSHEENCKQIELEKKKAEKDYAENEKLKKKLHARQDSEHLLVRSSIK